MWARFYGGAWAGRVERIDPYLDTFQFLQHRRAWGVPAISDERDSYRATGEFDYDGAAIFWHELWNQSWNPYARHGRETL